MASLSLARRLLSISLLIIAPSHVGALTMQAKAGFGNASGKLSFYRADSWNPLAVYLSGAAPQGIAQLQVTIQSGSSSTLYTRRVSFTGGNVNQVENLTVYIPSSTNSFTTIPLSITAQILMNGKSLAGKIPVVLSAPIDPGAFTLLPLTRSGGGLAFLQLYQFGLFHKQTDPQTANAMMGSGMSQNSGVSVPGGINPNASFLILPYDLQALPDSPQGYSPVDAVTLGDLPLDSLSDDQISALQGFVREGGLLIVSGGSDLAHLRNSALANLLPMKPETVRNVSSLPALSSHYRTALALSGGIPLTIGSLQPSARTLLKQGNVPLIVDAPYGDGEVVFTAFDLFSPPIQSWKGAPALWRDLFLCRNSVISARAILAHSGEGGEAQSLTDSLAGPRASRLPPSGLLVGFTGVYLFLLIPFTYALLKRLDRKELAWVTSPILILGFTVGAYVMGTYLKGGGLTLNRAVVLETQAGSNQAAGMAWLSLYSPSRESYTIAADNSGELLYPSPLTGEGGGVTIATDADASSMSGFAIPIWSGRAFQVPADLNLGGTFLCSEKPLADGRHIRVTISNGTRHSFSHCSFLNGSVPTSVNDLPPGGSITEILKWSYDQHASTLPIGYSTDGLESGKLTGNSIAESISDSLSKLLSYGQQNSGGMFPYFQTQTHQGYGLQPNAFLGWCDDQLLPVKVDGKPAGGQEVNFVIVNLPAPEHASSEIETAANPFLKLTVRSLPAAENGALRSYGAVMRHY